MDQFPPYVFLGRTVRPYSLGKPANLVHSSSDLPSRLFLGDLDRASFYRTQKGWVANYIDASPDTWTHIEYQAGTFYIGESLRGTSGGIGTAPGMDLRNLHMIHGQTPTEWDSASKKRLTMKYNLSWLDSGDDSWTISGFPDGHLKTIYCPLPLWKIPDLLKMLNFLREDYEIRCPAVFEIALGYDTVSYWKQRCPEIMVESIPLFWQHLGEVGYPPPSLPIFSSINEEEIADIRRLR